MALLYYSSVPRRTLADLQCFCSSLLVTTTSWIFDERDNQTRYSHLKNGRATEGISFRNEHNLRRLHKILIFLTQSLLADVTTSLALTQRAPDWILAEFTYQRDMNHHGGGSELGCFAVHSGANFSITFFYPKKEAADSAETLAPV